MIKSKKLKYISKYLDILYYNLYDKKFSIIFCIYLEIFKFNYILCY